MELIDSYQSLSTEHLTSLLIMKDLEIKTLQERIWWLEKQVEHLNYMLDEYEEPPVIKKKPIGF